MSFVSEAFLSATGWKEQVGLLLSRLGSSLEAAQGFVFEIVSNEMAELMAERRFHWRAPWQNPQNAHTSAEAIALESGPFSRWYDLLKKGRNIRGNVVDFPPPEEAALRSQNIASLFIAPIFFGEFLWGFIGFGDVREERPWTEYEADAIGIAARILGAAVQRSRMQEAFLDSEDELRAIFEHTPMMMGLLDAGKRLLRANRTLLDVGGRTEAEQIGQTLCQILECPEAEKLPESREGECYQDCALSDAITRSLDDGEIRTDIEMALDSSSDGASSVRHLRFDTLPLRILQERRILVCLSDITEEKRIAQLKDDFVGTVTHEFRTPLFVIDEMSSLILEGHAGPVTEEQADLLESTRGNIGRLNRIIDSLLDITRSESGKMELQLLSVDVSSLCGSAVQDLSHLARQKNIELISLPVGASPGDLTIQLDREKIEQVLYNLIFNAVKFTPENGRIQVGCATNEDSLSVFVADSGVGIAEEDLPHLFEKFTRFHKTEEGTTKGAGLGLSICKSIVDAHGGKIWAESTLGSGSTFYFSIPRTAPPRTHPRSTRHEPRPRARTPATGGTHLITGRPEG